MVRFLVDRPVAVLMTFLALLALGWVSYTYLPTSLMPDVAIPEITVHYSYSHSSARELENAVTAPLRRQLLQVGHLEDIRSETRDGTGMLYLRFRYGVNTNYAFIEVNEKIDAAMHSLPRDIDRHPTGKYGRGSLSASRLTFLYKGHPRRRAGSI